MGLLSAGDPARDFDFALRCATQIQAWWNEKQSPVYGFQLAIYKGSLKACCDIGEALFDSSYFANPPGPFKRAAGFVIIGRLNPFFKLVPLPSIPTGRVAEILPQTARERHAWLARFMVLAIPLVLRSTQAKIGSQWRVLSEWKGFPSLHYKLEFLAWLRWLDTHEGYRQRFNVKEWETITQNRMARMIMSASLMIESCYYQSENAAADSVRGNTASCFETLEEEHELDIIYDCHTPVTEAEFPPGLPS